ncbi:uncharacterized protein LOC127877138 isoform X2 [Dreissena polymorpha]|nr:uncharacterized protein LOC127877138 isoform X2 [Dreissena polymorpha]
MTDICKTNHKHKNLKTMKGTGGKSPAKTSKESLDKFQDSFVCEDNASIQNIKALFVETDKDLNDVQTSINSMSPNSHGSTKKKGMKNKIRDSSPSKADACKKKSPVKRTPKSSPSKQESSDLPAKGPLESPKTKRVYKKKSDTSVVKQSKKPENLSVNQDLSTCNADVETIQVSSKKKHGKTLKAKTDQLESSVDTQPEHSKESSPVSLKSRKKKSDLKTDYATDSVTKLTPKRSRSPKKLTSEKKTSPKKGAEAVRVLDFDDHEMKEQILKSISCSFPNNYKYQYRASSETFGRDLSDLIGKVNSALKEKPAVLKSVFGENVLPDSASSPESVENIEELDTINRHLTQDYVCDDIKEIMEGILTQICSKKDTADKNTHNRVNLEGNKRLDSDNVQAEEIKMETELKKATVVKMSSVKSKDICSPRKEKVNDDHQHNKKETVSIFEMYGLQLKKKPANSDATHNSSSEKSGVAADKESERKNQTASDTNLKDVSDTEKKLNHSEGDVLLDSECQSKKSVESIVISDDEEHSQTNKKYEKQVTKTKFVAINNLAEPKPIEILKKHEKKTSDKKGAFVCDELDFYLQSNKENHNASPHTMKFLDAQIKEELEKAEPDIDEVDGHVFLSFSSEFALKAHLSLESKIDWLTVGHLKKVAALKEMKERQNDAGTRRVTDVKLHDELKQSFRGIPMRMMKYQKLLKQEVEDMLTGRQQTTPFKCPLKPIEKTADVTKIKGWKNKFKTAEAIPDATGINVSESGKVHWRTEERLLKKLDPVEAKDIGLDLKKKRRKLVTYNKSKRGSKDVNEYQYLIDESVVTERDVYNEEEEMPLPDKIPYHVKYLSQHKYGARKMFVKKMKLDAEDERILKKLGTQKQVKDEDEDMETSSVCGKTSSRSGRGNGSIESAEKISMTMALEAVSALNMKLMVKAKSLSKGLVGKSYADEDYYEPCAEDVNDAPDDDIKPDARRARKASLRKRSNAEESGPATAMTDDAPVKIKKEMGCTEPGCRYGCICHLCRPQDSGEERDVVMDVKPTCDKEYCKLGCICESIDTNKMRSSHCRKPGCMLECKCPPKQPKPDIPRENTKKKKKGHQKRRKSTPVLGQQEEQLKDQSGPLSRGLSENEDWEPPSKKKKPTVDRYANLPRRETTYRLAKNLDAVSRKAMEVYATSEMYAEQKNFRRRKSDHTPDDSPHVFESLSAPNIHAERSTLIVKPEDVLEISDSDSEPIQDDIESCQRTTPYQRTARKHERNDFRTQNEIAGKQQGAGDMGGSVGSVDEDTKGANSSTNRRKSGKRSNFPSSAPSSASLSASEKLGLNRKVAEESPIRVEKVEQKWKTQMVCLKAKKKNDDKSESAEIKLLEIISNCQWENKRTNMLSKISHAISKDPSLGVTKVDTVDWDSYVLHFMIRADKPAMIPEELKSKLPSEMFSIRIKVTQKNEVDLTKENEPIVIKDDEDEKKKLNLTLQKKLIDKIKFAERLRNLIISEEQKGVKSSKFSVSREGIERALKKYKTQLWKSYTGCSNMSLQQMKEAVLAAKAGAARSQELSSQPVPSVSKSHSESSLDTNTINRISMNQGLKIVCPSSSGLVTLPGSRTGQGGFQPFVQGGLEKNGMLLSQNIPVVSRQNSNLVPSTSSFSSRTTVSSLIGQPCVAFVSEPGKTGLPLNTSGNMKVINVGAGVSNVLASSSSVVSNVRQAGVPGAVCVSVVPHSAVPVVISGPVSVHSSQKLDCKTKNVAVPLTAISKKSIPANQILLVPVSQGVLSGSGKLIGNKVVLIETEPKMIAPASNSAPVPVTINSSKAQRSTSPAGFVRPPNTEAIHLVPTPDALNNSLRQALPGVRLQYHGTVPSNLYPIKMAAPTCSSIPTLTRGNTSKPQSVIGGSVPPTSAVNTNAKSHISTPKAHPNTSPSKSCEPIVCEAVCESAKQKQSVDKVKNETKSEEDDQMALDPETGLLSEETIFAEKIKDCKCDDVIEIDTKDEMLHNEDEVLISQPIKTEGGVDLKPDVMEADNDKDLLQVLSETKEVDLSDISKFREFEEIGNQLTEQIKQIVASETAKVCPGEEVAKRKRDSPDFLDESEKSQSTKKACLDITRISINESEDSDVDIMTCDLGPGKPSLSPCSLSPASSQFFNEDSQLSGSAGLTKTEQEKSRRITLKYLLKNLNHVTFKYNQKLATYKTGIPKHFVLAESVQLVKALKARNRSLEESLDDGRQYQKSLQKKLEILVGSFVQSGVPETIIKNFLKSVTNAALSTHPLTNRRRGQKSAVRPDSESEESDTELEYDRVTTKDVLSVHSPYTTLMTDKPEDGKIIVPEADSPPPFLRYRLGAQWENSLDGEKHTELPKQVSVERCVSDWNHADGTLQNVKVLEKPVQSPKAVVSTSQRVSNIDSAIRINNTDLKINPALSTVNSNRPRVPVSQSDNNHSKQTVLYGGVCFNHGRIDKSSIKIIKAVGAIPSGAYHQAPHANTNTSISYTGNDKLSAQGLNASGNNEPVVIDSDSIYHSSDEDEVRSSTGDNVMSLDDEMGEPLTNCLQDSTESEDLLRAMVEQQIT